LNPRGPLKERAAINMLGSKLDHPRTGAKGGGQAIQQHRFVQPIVGHQVETRFAQSPQAFSTLLRHH
jgi:hypothetical protein